jgi:hypothetical protein
MALKIYTFALSLFCFSLSSFQCWSTYHHILVTSITLTISSSITWCIPTYLYISLIAKVSTLRFHQLSKTKLELSLNDISCEVKRVETLDVSVDGFCWLVTVLWRKVVLKLLILVCIHQASCFVLHHIKHTLSSRVIPWTRRLMLSNQSPRKTFAVEVGFDICGTNRKPEISIDQDKPRMHLTILWVLQSLHDLYLCFVH